MYLYWKYFLFFCFIVLEINAQPILIRRFTPGNYKSDNVHQIELYNATNQAIDVKDYLLVTRDYSVYFLPKTIIAAQGIFSIGKKKESQKPLHLELTNYSTFLIRLFSRKVEGNYVVLFNPQGVVVQAFYYSQLPNIPFLPDLGQYLKPNKQTESFKLPPEQDTVWKYFGTGDDPAIGFVQINGEWKVTAANPSVNTIKATDYQQISGRYNEGVATLKWTTTFEDGLKNIDIERSTDQEQFNTITTIHAIGKPNFPQQYTYYDTAIQQDTIYYYRLKHQSLLGIYEYSKVIEIQTKTIKQEFSMQVITAGITPQIRFYSAYSQKLTMKILNDKYTEVAILYNNYVNADSENLLQLIENLPNGNYILVAMTEAKRYFQHLNIYK